MAIINDPNNPQNQLNGAAKPQGSGQFTNIQKYLTANKTAGQNIANSIGNTYDKNTKKEKDNYSDQNSQIAQNINNSKQALQQGQGFLNTTKQIGSDIAANTGEDKYNAAGPGVQSATDFRNSNDYGKFQTFQAGNAVNNNDLNFRQQNLQNSNSKLSQAANALYGNVQNDQGRLNILQKQFQANPQYTQGQQSLDNLFLQKGGLPSLTNKLGTEVSNYKTQASNLAQQGKDISGINQTESSLIGDLSSQTGANASAFTNMLQSYIPGINKARDAEVAAVQQQLTNARTNQTATFTDDQLSKLGVNKGPQQVFNTFKGVNDLRDVANVGANANTFKDIVRQNDLSQYNALADIANIDVNNRSITETRSLDPVYAAREGDASLQSRIGAEQKRFNDIANTNNYDNVTRQEGQRYWERLRLGNLNDIIAGKQGIGLERGESENLKNDIQANYSQAAKDLYDNGYFNAIGNGNNFEAGGPLSVQTTDSNIGAISHSGLNSGGYYDNHIAGSNIDEQVAAFRKRMSLDTNNKF
jgi:hypothetical protein